jgi:hypothetical protein
MVSPATLIERPLSLQDELNRPMEIPGVKIKKTPPKKTFKKNLRETMDIISYPIQIRQSTWPWTQEYPEYENLGQYHYITVPKVKPKESASWRQTVLQKIPHPPEDMAFKQWRHSPQTFDSSLSSQESFNSPETGIQPEEMENKPSTSRGDDIYEARAGDTQNCKGPPRTAPMMNLQRPVLLSQARNQLQTNPQTHKNENQLRLPHMRKRLN